MARDKEMEVPRFQQSHYGVALHGTAWKLNRHGAAVPEIYCELRLAGWVRPDYAVSGQIDRSWRLEITRPKRSRGKTGVKMIGDAFVARLFEHGSPVSRTIMRGTCEGGKHRSDWQDAALQVQQMVNIPAVMKEMATLSTYGPETRSRWSLFRPFIVKYPWRDPEEPNAKYSPFTLCRGLGYDVESDGALCCQLDVEEHGSRDLASNLKANAFLVGPDEEGHYWVYHRSSMSTRDVIDIDDWRARIIAGTQD